MQHRNGSRNHAAVAIGIAAALLQACASTAHEEPGPSSGQIDLAWIYDPDRSDVSDLPQTAWRADGRLIVFDPRVAADERTFELLDPTSGSRTPLVEPGMALDTLPSSLGDGAPDALTWPLSFDPAGERALYLVDDDVFVLELWNSSFRRLTETDAEETSPSFSPDGSRVAFVRDNDLFVVTVATGEETRITSTGTETLLNGTLSWVYWEEIFGRRDIGYWWSPDSSRIAFLETDESEVSEVVFPDFQPAVPEIKRQRYPKAGGVNPTVRAGIAAVSGGAEPTWIGLDPESFEYLVRVQWLPAGDRLAVQTMTRDQRRLELAIVDASSGAVAPLLTETNEAWVNIHDDLYFLDDGERFVWASERSGYAHLYLGRLSGGSLTPITSGDWALRSSGGVFWLRQCVCAIDEANDWIYFTALKESSIERQLYRVHLDGSGLERVSEGRGVHRITFAPGGRSYADVFSSVDTPPSLALHAPDGALQSVLCAPRGELLDGVELTSPELFTIPARDGFAMPARLHKPRDFDPGHRYPLILHVYGGPSAPMVTDSWNGDRYFNQMLADRGFLVASVDNRVATAISKDLENEIALRSIGDSELNDFVDAARWFKRQDYVDPDRVGIWGWSGGGSMTLLCLTRSDEFRAGIAVAAVTDWRYYDTKWAEFTMKTPEENPDGYTHTSLAERAGDLSGRLLLVHGTYDDNVHPQNAWRFADELVAAGVPFDMMIYPMRKHGISDRAARMHLYGKMLEFWQLYLAAE